MSIKKLHYLSGLTLSLFIGLHLFNHFYSIFGADKHLQIMHFLRLFYRNPLAETILLAAVAVQIFSGLRLFKTGRATAVTRFDRLHIWSGLYLAVFLIIHLSAVMAGRYILHLDTNFYFGAAGLNTFPFNLFFIPYYGFAIISFFAHIASIHNKKMKQVILGLSPGLQSKTILLFGVLFTVLVLYGLTNHFKGIEVPKDYQVLIGK